jgi:hypothetical protein
VALANHHDNFDAYDSKYHAWNSVNVGPKQDSFKYSHTTTTISATDGQQEAGRGVVRLNADT